ncbi:alpha/beta hydrolase [Galbibacter sp. BG1]|nr:alpha/beta hydrolase [Galbibacter sp. BG1]
MHFRLLAISAFCSFCTFSQDKIIPLYDGKIPNSTGISEKEIHTDNGLLEISNVQEPTLETFLPSKQNANGKAVIICPGGGYHYLAYHYAGTNFAKWFNSKGYTAFVLKYRLPIANTVKNKAEVPLQDAKRAIQVIRKNADKWNLNPESIGIMGLSAGGHVASTLATHFNSDTGIPKDPYKDISARPDFLILAFPVITMDKKYTHMGSRKALLGESPSEEKIKLYSNELQVTSETPPTFLVHCEDDKAVPVENSLLFYRGLTKHGVSAEMHLYPKGGHGFGLALNNKHLQSWTDRLYNWLDFIDNRQTED